MDDIIFYMALSTSILTLLFIINLLRKRSSNDAATNESEPEPVRPERPQRPQTVRFVGGSRVVRRSRLNRTNEPEPSPDHFDGDNFGGDDVDDDDDVGVEDDSPKLAKPFADDQNIGTKKRKKLEMKAERKAQREQELNEREERQKRKQQEEEKRKKQEDEEAAEKAKQLEEEKRLLEEKKRQEHEEYLKLKETFEIESSGFEEQPLDGESNMLNDFIQHVINEKVVILEDLASKFNLKTQEVIDRINSLLESKQLTGVIDDRGKFIYISKEELQTIAKFIRQRGRVTIAELVENSNSLIMMAHKQKDIAVNS